jgi:carbonic anhydrase
MSCNTPNINTNNPNKCNLKCIYWYNYGNSTCRIRNETNYIMIPYDGSSQVTFNSTSYTPRYINIFKPALHQFNGSSADAEMIIFHTSQSGQGLLVCIPILSSNSNQITYLNQIIDQIPNEGEDETNLNIPNFNLNNVIPKAPYYFYKNNLIWNCISRTIYNYVVFNPSQGFVSVSSTMLNKLGQMIQPLELSGEYNGIVYYNMNGTTSNNQFGDDQIYIDCKPTGEYGEVIDNTSPTNTGDQGMNDESMDKLTEYIYSFLYIIIGFIFFYIIYYIYNNYINKEQLNEIYK